MKYIVGIVIAVFAVVMLAHTASAHVLVTDQTGSNGAILHIVPDDDPIAGKQAMLFLDTQKDLLNSTSSVTLTISSEVHGQESATVKIDGALVTAQYIFPSQGVYTIRFDITTNGVAHVFEQNLRVSRGVVSGTHETGNHAWAEGLLIGCGVLFLALGIIAWNNRKGIARQSIF